MKNLLSDMEGVARTAGTILLSTQHRARKTEIRKQDFVTQQDLDSGNLIRSQLAQLYPDVTFYGEESGETISDRMWVVDPIDGTTNYFHRDEFWGISIAFVEKGVTSAGLVYLPGIGLLFSAQRDRRATVDVTKRVSVVEHVIPRVSTQDALAESRVWTDWRRGDHAITIDILAKLDRHTTLPQIRVCCTASMMQVALGKVDGYVHPGPQPFDIAAAGLIVEQVGGTVTDLQGNPWTPWSQSIVATNGRIHNQLLDVLGALK